MQKIETKEFLRRYWWILKKEKISWDNLMICCPFHNEQNPSFWLLKNTYYDWKSFYCKWWCFTCHAKWLSLESFISQLEWTKKNEAFKLAKELMWFDEDSLYLSWEIDKDRFVWFRDDKNNNNLNWYTQEEYLNEFDTFTPHEYILNRWFTISSWLKYDFWFSETRKRISLPLKDEDWNIVSIIWRSISSEINPKYLYINKEWHNVDKSHYLFNLNNVDFNRKNVILVEWPFNSIAIDQFWETNSVAIMWSKISDEQYEKLMTYFDEITLWLDDDDAWRDWTKDILKRIKKDDRKISKKVYVMKSQKDAADMNQDEFNDTFKNREEIDLLFSEENKQQKKKKFYKKEDDLNDKINNLKKITL